MTELWLIANNMSRSTDESAIDGACTAIERQGARVTRRIDLSREDLPGSDAALPDIVASLGGDGTANAVIERFGAAEGPRLLILPGGTMNLLASRLHGEATVEEAIMRGLRDGRVHTLPLIEGPDFRSLVGIIAGPAASWGDVREDIREGGLESLIENVRTALEATFEGALVHLSGRDEGHKALFVEPQPDGLHAHDVQADSLADLVRHGWAWLNRDFLGGPTEEVKHRHELVIESTEPDITLLVDGERKSATSPLTLTWAECPARFIATLES